MIASLSNVYNEALTRFESAENRPSRLTQVKVPLGSAWYFFEEVLDVILDVVLSMAST